MFEDVLLLDSITDAGADAAGRIGVSGSHGGLFAAALASNAGLRAVVLNDAGRGLEDAGIAGIRALDDVGMAGATVTTMSAEIGSARATLDTGVISFVNRTAQALGLVEGKSLKEQIALLQAAPEPAGPLAAVEEARWEERIGDLSVLCVDSASLITPEDASRVIVTGSHGGLIGGDPERACKARARLVAFNDAGGGRNGIGYTRLPALEERGVAAVTLDCHTCRIGDAASALATGVISGANAPAERLGFHPGLRLADALADLAP